MDEENKEMLDLFHKCNLLSLEMKSKADKVLCLKRLRFIMIEQNIIKDENILDDIEDCYCFSFKQCTKNVSESLFSLIKDEPEFNVEKYTIPDKNESSNIKNKIEDTNNEKNLDEKKIKSDFTNASFLPLNIKRNNNSEDNENMKIRKTQPSLGGKFRIPLAVNNSNNVVDEKQQNPNVIEIKGIDQNLIEIILNDVVEKNSKITWNDVAGLEFIKKTIEEVIIWPMLRPDMFKGLLGPAKGLLLFGPPGTGKTLIGKCIANQCCAKFFSISSSTLTSKWFGEAEKLVRALFEVAKHYQPSVIFIDEIDSLLTCRQDGEHESTRRLKTEFLVQLDGCNTNADDRVLIIGATNRPQELDEAARRRFVKRFYVPLPNDPSREKIIVNLLSSNLHSLTTDDIFTIVQKTAGYSGADMTCLCKEAALGPIRDVKNIESANISDLRPISVNDFYKALKCVKPTVSTNDVSHYLTWNNLYGSCMDS